jgi:ribosomal-protein-alanine N-acetyltransferase
MVDKEKIKMLGHCNYTKIKNNKCWLGFSISKASEGKSLMYEALRLTNAYVMKNLGIKEIRAGILPNNDRSIRLIKRLDFKYVGEKDELEINGETRTYGTYLLSS